MKLIDASRDRLINANSVLTAALVLCALPGAALAATGDELLSGLTDQERSWVEESCPRSLGPSVYLSCVEREFAAIRAGIPDLTVLPDDQQAWVRESCPESLGPSVFASCAKRELSALRGWAVDLESFDPDTRQWIEESCPRSLGPSVYASCVERETSALSGGTVTLESLDSETRQWVENSCPRSLGPSIYTSCVKRELGAIKRQAPKSLSEKKVRESSRLSSRKSEQATENRSGTRPPQKEERDSTNTFLGIILLIFLAVLLLPIVCVLFSSRSHGGAKFGWFLVVLFFSWLGFAVFLILTQKSRDAPAE